MFLKSQITNFNIPAKWLSTKSTVFHRCRKRALQYFFYILSIFVHSKVKKFADCLLPSKLHCHTPHLSRQFTFIFAQSRHLQAAMQVPKRRVRNIRVRKFPLSYCLQNVARGGRKLTHHLSETGVALSLSPVSICSL